MSTNAREMIQEYQEEQKNKSKTQVTISVEKKNSLAKIKNFVYNIFRK